MQKIYKIILALVLVIVIFMTGIYFGRVYFSEISEASKANVDLVANQEVSLMIDFGNGEIEVYNNLAIKQEKTLKELLEEIDGLNLQTEDYGEMGILLTSLKNYQNGQNNNYWQYWVNNIQPMISIDKFNLQEGDIVELKFTKSKF